MKTHIQINIITKHQILLILTIRLPHAAYWKLWNYYCNHTHANTPFMLTGWETP